MFESLKMISSAKQIRLLLTLFIATAVVEGLTLTLLIPFIRSLLVDQANLTGWAIAVVVGGVLLFVLTVWGNLRSYHISVYDVCDVVIERVANRTLKLPLGWFNAKREALIASVMSREVNSLSHVSSVLLPALASQFVVPAVLMVALVFVDWRVSLVMLVTIPLLWLGWKFMQRSEDAADRAESAAATTTAGRLIEFARLQPILRAGGVTRTGWKPLDNALAEENRALQHAMNAKSRPIMVYTFIVDLALAAVLLVAFYVVALGQVDMPTFLAVAVIAVRIAHPLSLSAVYGSEIHRARVALDKVRTVLEAEPLPEPGDDAVHEITEKSVNFRGVTFGYDPAKPVLSGVDFTAQAGQVTALVGASGSGKSTLLRLAARFWDVDEGEVSIGGVDVRRIPTPVLMNEVSMVFQDVYLFDTTIRENLRLARPDATDEELENAAKQARLDSVIASLPDGWDTVVGQGGTKLSGGERQRVSIARAFIKDAPILLLDEITSALDGENEAAIAQVMGDLAQGRTVVVVAHRMSTIRGADKVVVLAPGENGAPSQVSQVGTPAELLDQEGIFASFVAASQEASHWRIG